MAGRLEKLGLSDAVISKVLKQIAEDTYLLASNLHNVNEESLLEYGNELEGLSKDEIEAHRAWRIVELLVGIGDRICATAGLDPTEDVWVPDDLKEMVG